MTPAEMVRCALAEVGLGHVAVRDAPSGDGVRWRKLESNEDRVAVRKAVALVRLRTLGPLEPMKCIRHTKVTAICATVTVAEVLLDPYVDCGAP